MSRPWMPLYVADYLADTGHLRAAQSGAYLHLIMHYWLKGVLPNDDAQLAAIARMDRKEWGTARPIIQAFFTDGWTHKRIDKELASSSAAYERRAAAGRIGGNAKSKSNHCLSNATNNVKALHKLSQSQLERGLSGKNESRGLDSNCQDHELDHSWGEP